MAQLNDAVSSDLMHHSRPALRSIIRVERIRIFVKSEGGSHLANRRRALLAYLRSLGDGSRSVELAASAFAATQGFMDDLLRQVFGFASLESVASREEGSRVFPVRGVAQGGRVPIAVPPGCGRTRMTSLFRCMISTPQPTRGANICSSLYLIFQTGSAMIG